MDDRDPTALLVAAAAAGDEYAWREMADRYAAAPTDPPLCHAQIGPAGKVPCIGRKRLRSCAREMEGVMPHRWDDDQHLLDDLGDAVREAARAGPSRGARQGGLQLANRRGGPAAGLPRF